MNVSRSRQRLSRTTRLVATATIASTALGLSACTKARTPPPPGPQITSAAPTTATSSPSPSPAQPASVVGHLEVEYIKVTRDAILPQAPITYTLVVNRVGSKTKSEYPVDANGDFGITLPPGSYDMPLLVIQSADMKAPLRMPMANAATLRFTAPATGCVYAGQLHVRYGRLPAGTLQQQTAMVQKLVQTVGHPLAFGYVPNGGIVVVGGETSIATVNARPAAAHGCTVREFTSTSS